MRRNPDGFIWVVSWILFISCSIGLFSLGYECIQKYLESPQTVDISTHGQSELDLPVFTLCPRSSEHGEADPPPLNITNLEQCGLTYEMLLNGSFRGSGISTCGDPDEFWNFVHLKPKDFGIKLIEIHFFDLTFYFISAYEDDPAWEKKLVFDGNGWNFRTCLTMNLPKKSTNIREIVMRAKKDKSFELYIYSPGQLNHIPWMSVEYKIVLFDSNKGSNIDVMYIQHIMPYETGKCNPFQNSSKDMTDRMEQKIEETFGCVTPFAGDKTNLCKNLTIEKYQGMTKEEFNIWQQSCKFLGNFILVEKQNSFPQYLVIELNTAVQKIESKYSYLLLDLFADLGGYLGIFLGYSLFQLKDAISYLMRKCI